MMKMDKKLTKYIIVSITDDILKRKRYATAVTILNSEEIMRYIRMFIGVKNSHIKKADLQAAKKIINLSKVLYDINVTRPSILFRLIPNEFYDTMLEKYKDITGDEPFPTDVPTGMRAVTHTFPELVGTLDKAYTVYEIGKKPSVEKFIHKVLRDSDLDYIDLIVMNKFDGSSIEVQFKEDNGLMYPIGATSRGDTVNNKGVDMSQLLIGREPKEYDYDYFVGHDTIIGIQYEAMVSEKGRIRLSEITGISYNTRRAAIAAAIKRVVNDNTPLDEKKSINECISLIPIGVSNNLLDKVSPITWYEIMRYVSNTFKYDNYSEIYSPIILLIGEKDSLLEKFQELLTNKLAERNNLPYSIDGLVISAVDLIDLPRLEMGRSNNKNKWQIAYKFGAIVQRTHVTGIITTQGNMGYMGHNITFNAIEFNGVVYEKAPVNNKDRFKKLDLRVGDEVLVSYNADVMGYIYKDDTCIPNKDGVKLKFPKICFHCSSELIENKNMLRCINPECKGNAIGKILETIRILNIDFFGDETAQALVEVGVTDTIKFIEMTKTTLERVLKGKNLEKAYEEFKEKITQEIDYSKVIDLLRIEGLRTSTGKKIIDHLGISTLKNYMKDESIKELSEALKTVPGIDTKAGLFSIGLIEKNDEFLKLCQLLNVTHIKSDEYEKIILISGFRTNPEFEGLCKKLNYGIVDSGKYDILVVTPDRLSGSKATKAKKSGKPIYTLPQFLIEF